MDTYARRVAVAITGRTQWGEGRGPAGYSGRDHIDLIADLLFKPDEMFREELIPLGRKKLKAEFGLDPDAKFFAPGELMLNEGLHRLSGEVRTKGSPKVILTPSLKCRSLKGPNPWS